MTIITTPGIGFSQMKQSVQIKILVGQLEVVSATILSAIPTFNWLAILWSFSNKVSS
jgi:hypothetical protein